MKPDFVTFVGGWGQTPVEQMMASAQRTATLDTLDKARQSNSFGRLILVADAQNLGHDWGPDIIVEPSPSPFHFGRQLKDLVNKHRIQKLLYLGSGSLPLLPIPEMARIAEELSANSNILISNNPYSGDLIAFHPSSVLENLHLVESDNALSLSLWRDGGLDNRPLEKNLVNLMDIDTPTDLAILSLLSGLGPYLTRYIRTLQPNTEHILKAAVSLTNQNAQVFVAGRVGSFLWSRLESEAACKCRVVSEERGMRAEGREGKETVTSLLGLYVEDRKPSQLFQALARFSDAVFIDSRVLFHHLHLNPSPQDRFLSDLMCPPGIADPWIREFTQAAVEAPIPVVLGGHSLVSWGLLALIDVAWSRAGPS